MAVATVANFAARGVLSVSASRGIDVAALMRQAGLDERQLAKPGIRVPLDSVIQLWEHARRSTGDEHEQMKWLLFAGMLTTVAHSYYMLARYQRAIETDYDPVPYVSLMSWLTLGQYAEIERITRNARTEASHNPHLSLLFQLLEYVENAGKKLELQHNNIGSPHLSFVVEDLDAKFAQAQGMRTLREDGLAKVLLGDTTLEEVARVVV